MTSGVVETVVKTSVTIDRGGAMTAIGHAAIHLHAAVRDRLDGPAMTNVSIGSANTATIEITSKMATAVLNSLVTGLQDHRYFQHFLSHSNSS